MEKNLKGPKTIFRNGKFFKVCMLEVIDTSIKSQGDTTTDSKSQIFLREVRRRFRGFSENAFNFVKSFLTKLKTREGYHPSYALLPTRVVTEPHP